MTTPRLGRFFTPTHGRQTLQLSVAGRIKNCMKTWFKKSEHLTARTALVWLVAASFTLTGAARGRPQEVRPAAPEYTTLVGTYCVTCHNDRLKTAGLSLQSPRTRRTFRNTREVWEKVARKLRSGEMPPSTVRSRPDAADRRSAGRRYLETTLDRAAVAHPNPGRAPVHRLNRAEYSNAIRDLLAVDVRPGEWLPVDDSGYGFDNIAAVLSTSPALLDRYMSAARKVSRLAVGDLTLKPVEEIYDAKRDPNKGSRNEQLNDDLPFDSRAGMTVEHYFPLDAEYVFKIRFVGRSGRRRRDGDRSVPGAGRGEGRTPHGRRDIAAREPEGGKRRARRRQAADAAARRRSRRPWTCDWTARA